MINLLSMSWEISLALIPLGMLVVMIMARNSQRNRVMSAHNQLLDSLRPGMRINVGGIIGRIKTIKEDATGMKTILLQTGDDKNPGYILVDARAVVGVMDDEMAAVQPTEVETPSVSPDAEFDAEQFAKSSNKSRKKS